ncbi:MAG: HAD family hydrolase [SAR324 cluster bacterium]|nr:HAD family hydrolase [SAR324 cluster bacterium]MDP7463106.1 HAD family hydrolase [SAR324 cluster bacterium]MDP7629112.1 HAD family hydrolase [SAR324 cluster bacterium]
MPIKVADILQRRHWVFDMDGTLTIAVHDFTDIRKELGFAEGQPIVKTLNALPDEQAQPLRQRLQEIEEGLARQAQPAPGVQNLLAALKLRGCRMGILTLNSKENAWLTLQTLGLAEFFEPEAVLGRWCLENPKPHPDGIHQLLDFWNADSDDAVMVGDFLWDLKTGRAAGLPTVHVDLSGAFPWPELTDLPVASLHDLQNRLP